MAKIKYVGPYSPEAYKAAGMIQKGGAGAPYAPNVVEAGEAILGKQGGTTAPASRGTTSGGGSSANTAEAQAAIDNTNKAVSSLDLELGTGYKNIDDSFGSIINKYDTESARAAEDYNEETVGNNKTLDRNRQNALLAASQGRRGLRGTLGAIGALSGDGEVLADNAVRTSANQDIGEATDTYATNAQTLDKSKKRFDEEDADRRREAETAKANQRTALEGSVAGKRQSLLQTLASLFSGAGRTSEATAALNQAGDLNSVIASKSAVQATPITARSAAFTPGDLESYLAGAGDLTVDVRGGGEGAPTLVAGRTIGGRRKREDEVAA